MCITLRSIAMTLALAAWTAAAGAAGPTELLSHEHEVIKRVLAVMDAMAARAEEHGALDTVAAGEVVELLTGFADKCHHAKEEQHLFPALEAAELEESVAALLKEHAKGRAEVRALRAIAEKDKVGPADVRRFVKHARAYAALLGEHIESEDEKLFPHAEHVLTSEARTRLAEAFEKVEAEEMGEGTHEKYLEMVKRLEARYGLAGADEEAEAGAAHDHGSHGEGHGH